MKCTAATSVWWSWSVADTLFWILEAEERRGRPAPGSCRSSLAAQVRFRPILADETRGIPGNLSHTWARDRQITIYIQAHEINRLQFTEAQLEKFHVHSRLWTQDLVCHRAYDVILYAAQCSSKLLPLPNGYLKRYPLKSFFSRSR